MTVHRRETPARARLGRAALLGSIAGIALATPAARGQTPPAAPAAPATASPTETAATIVVAPVAEKSNRELAGHLFLPSHLIQDPFSVTSFGSYFGVGTGQALGPELVDLGPPPVFAQDAKWYGYTGLAQQFGLDVRIIEYLSARLMLTAGAYQGTGSGSALVVGTNIKALGDLELKGSLPLGKHVRLALSAGAAYGPVYNILILEGLVDVINACRADPNCTISASDFLQESDTVTWKATLSAAWAPFPFLGFMGNVQFLNPRQTGSTVVSQNGLRLGAAAEFDAKPLVSWLPLGLSVVYAIVSPIGSGGVTTTQNTGFGLFYTGRKDLALGIELNWQQGRLESSLVSEATLAWVDFRYYW